MATAHLQSRGYRILARWAPLAAHIAVALIACGYSWHLLRHSSLWYDEAFTADLVEQSWSAFWYTIWHSDINMVVYYVLLRGWVDLLRQAGVAPTELWLRLPSALSIVMSALVALQLGRRLWGMFEGIVGAVGYAVSYLTLYSAQQTRSYGLYLLLLSLGWYAFVSALAPDADTRAPSRRWWVAHTMWRGRGLRRSPSSRTKYAQPSCTLAGRPSRALIHSATARPSHLSPVRAGPRTAAPLSGELGNHAPLLATAS